MHHIEAEVLIANVLKRREKVSIRELIDIEEKITKKFSSINILLSNSTIYFAIQYYPEIFKWNDKYIQRTEKYNDICNDHYLDSLLNYQIPENLKSEFLSSIAEYAK
ncbi:hypothetical protein J4465_00375 [Candidatus Pacearchaeota archaeon]|nr:hypothetical protein [Candidatus Pacearchaeota archaeon]